jgi:acyl-CoA synthetase (AMP-forming)/AMP-acid ligase II
LSYFEDYLNLPHLQNFKTLERDSLLREVEEALGQKSLKNRVIPLFHSSAPAFALCFLRILDEGGTPLALAHEGQRRDFQDTPAPEDFRGYYVPTSGTTGRPKLCAFSLETALKNSQAHAESLGIDQQHEIVQTLPCHHSYGIIAYLLTPLVTGASVNFCSGLVGLRSFSKHPTDRKRILHASPSQIRFALRDQTKPQYLSKISVGGGSISVHELLNVDQLLAPIDLYVTYGLTEAGPRVTTGHLSREKKELLKKDPLKHWIGSAIPGVKIWTKDNNTVGRLCVSSPYLMKSQEGKSLTEDFLITRDQVEIIDGEVFFLSRENDLIKYGGVTLYPLEIENLIRQWTGVSDCMILPVEDPLYGHLPLVAIEGPITTEEAVNKSIDLPHSTAFKNFCILEKFPRKSLDKIDRDELLKLCRLRKS